jgi:hypothetical protein
LTNWNIRRPEDDPPDPYGEFLIALVKERYGSNVGMGGEKLKADARMKLETYLHDLGHANIEEKLEGFRRQYLGQ